MARKSGSDQYDYSFVRMLVRKLGPQNYADGFFVVLIIGLEAGAASS
jgi:hypothetical protein